jgi:DNA modification methylase
VTEFEVIAGDCREIMRGLDAESVDAIVTDPPYELGFMGKRWDGSGIAYDAAVWSAALRVLKPGGYLLAFGGTRTYHRMAVAIEDAGFEIRDCIAWMYGQGFPKSLNVSASEIFCQCRENEVKYTHDEPQTEHDMRNVRDGDVPQAERTDGGSRPVLQPRVSEPRSPAEESQAADDARTGQSGMERRRDGLAQERQLQADQVRSMSAGVLADGAQRRLRHGASAYRGEDVSPLLTPMRGRASSRPRSGEQCAVESDRLSEQPDSQACRTCGKRRVSSGLGTALKPAFEPIVVARKPLVGTVAANVERYGTGALNIDGCRIETSENLNGGAYADHSAANYKRWEGGDLGRMPGQYEQPLGRWPANVALDEDAAAMLDAQSGERVSRVGKPRKSAQPGDGYGMTHTGAEYNDRGGASRFFYCAKASRSERNAGLDGMPEREHANHNIDGRNRQNGRNYIGAYSQDGGFNPDYRPSPAANHHPTVKPIALMRWLVRLVTPPGGLVFDPFTGSGSTGCAAAREGFDFLGCDLDPEYVEIARRRIAHHATLAEASRDAIRQADMFDGEAA